VEQGSYNASEAYTHQNTIEASSLFASVPAAIIFPSQDTLILSKGRVLLMFKAELEDSISAAE
jgi:hypothetical protein